MINVAKDEKKSKGEASKASKELKDKKSSPAKKSAAASTLSKSSDKKVSSPEIGLHLFHPNARCTASGVLYFKDRCGRS
ncbi:hypothetical protein ACIQVE_22310, partial [Pseudomonas sp. NPDC098747]